MTPRKILIVDDEPFNVDYLEQEIEDLGYDTVSVNDGFQALQVAADEPPDMILLDIQMPVMDGFEVLSRLKADESTRHIPVVIVSAHADLEKIARGIEMGAEDYLPKPIEPVLLEARLTSGLARKRLRDLELEYLEQVGFIIQAAAAVEDNQFDPDSLAPVALREDALGQLARVFQRMAEQVHAREQRLKRLVDQMRLDIEEQSRSNVETASAYISMDRRQALAGGWVLPNRALGTALMVDISGFTPLTAALTSELGLQRGAEELLRYLNQIFGALTDEMHRFGGSVIGFSGDAVSCWFAEEYPPAQTKSPEAGSQAANTEVSGSALRALGCALRMQALMADFAQVSTPTGTCISFAIKVSLAGGWTGRFLAGDPALQQLEAFGGLPVDEISLADHLALPGEVLVQEKIARLYAHRLKIDSWRIAPISGLRFAVVSDLSDPPPANPWPALDPQSPSDEHARPWLLPAVYEWVRSGKSLFLAELRAATALMLQFAGIDYDSDPQAASKLDQFIRWVQRQAAEHGGSLIQLTIGEKGSFCYLCFGAPIAHSDDPIRAVAAALAFLQPPPELSFIEGVQIGLAHGQMRAGAFGSSAQRTYGVMGEKTNLAARLMQASEGGILCDESVFQAARGRYEFAEQPPMALKGLQEPVITYRPLIEKKTAAEIIDNLPPGLQVTLKIASVIGQVVPFDLLQHLRMGDVALQVDVREHLLEQLQQLEELDLLGQDSSQAVLTYVFCERRVREAVYHSMLFSQRRQLHRSIAVWIEANYPEDLAPHYLALAHHWRGAEDAIQSAYYLEQAGLLAQRDGRFGEALRYFEESLSLDSGAGLDSV